MAGLTRRRFVLLSAVALLGAACGAPEAEQGLRGTGTVLHPRELPPVTVEPTAEPTRLPTLLPNLPVMPTPQIVPTPEPDLIVPNDALPAIGGSDAEAHVFSVPTRAPAVQPLPAKRIVIPSIGLDSKVIQLGTKLDR